MKLNVQLLLRRSIWSYIPGAHVGAGSELAIQSIIKGLDIVNENNNDLIIALETMAGKGTEIGRTFEEIAQIIAVNVQKC